MAKYRKVSVQIWNDEKFRTFSDDGKLAFLFLLTHQHMTSIGAMRGNWAGIAAELGWSVERVSKGFRKGLELGLIWYDEKASCIVLPNFIKHNEPENPNVVKGWAVALELIPECSHKCRLFNLLAKYIETCGEPFRKGFETVCQTISKPFRIPEPEPEPEQERKGDYAASPPSAEKREGRDEAFDLFASQHQEATQTPYRGEKKDFVQLAALRKRFGLAGRTEIPGWTEAAGNYFASPLGAFTLADLCVRYAVFRNSPLDRYGKPINHKNAGGRSDDKHERNKRVAEELLSELRAKDRSSGVSGIE